MSLSPSLSVQINDPLAADNNPTVSSIWLLYMIMDEKGMEMVGPFPKHVLQHLGAGIKLKSHGSGSNGKGC